jgi:hypothetical protein
MGASSVGPISGEPAPIAALSATRKNPLMASLFRSEVNLHNHAWVRVWLRTHINFSMTSINMAEGVSAELMSSVNP